MSGVQHEIIGNLNSVIDQIPVELLPTTLFNLVQYNLPNLAIKAVKQDA
jgi:hypothetical protein